MSGELGFTTGPFVSVAAFCDQVIEGKDQTLSVIRIIDTVSVSARGPDAPDELRPGGASVTTTLVVALRAGQALGAQAIGITLEHPNTERESLFDGSVNFAPGPHGVNIVAPLRFALRGVGLHWADISVNGRLVSHSQAPTSRQVGGPAGRGR